MPRTIKLTEEERERLVAEIDPEFPKYTTQIMNTANQNSQGTRPRVVGQMSEIIEEYKEEYPNGDFDDWKAFYYSKYDGEERIEEATQKVFEMVVKMREATKEIDEEMVRRWVNDLVLYKTYLVWDGTRKPSSRNSPKNTNSNTAVALLEKNRRESTATSAANPFLSSPTHTDR